MCTYHPHRLHILQRTSYQKVYILFIVLGPNSEVTNKTMVWGLCSNENLCYKTTCNIPPKSSVKTKTKVPDLKHKTVWYRMPKTLGKEAFKFRNTFSLTNCSFWLQNALRVMCHCKWCRKLGKLYCGMTACRRMLQIQLNLTFSIPRFRVAATNLARSWRRDTLLQHWTLKQELRERRKKKK